MSGCYASSEFSDVYSCSKALDGDLNTDFATNGEGEGAWIQVKDLIDFHFSSMQYLMNTNPTDIDTKLSLFTKISSKIDHF